MGVGLHLIHPNDIFMTTKQAGSGYGVRQMFWAIEGCIWREIIPGKPVLVMVNLWHMYADHGACPMIACMETLASLAITG